MFTKSSNHFFNPPIVHFVFIIKIFLSGNSEIVAKYYPPRENGGVREKWGDRRWKKECGEMKRGKRKNAR